jgi:hypothetical protein
MEEVGKRVVGKNGAKLISHPEVYIVMRESRVSHAGSLFRDGWNGLWVERHR